MNDEKISFHEAWNKAKEKIVYTNHTLVVAGNPTYPSSTVSYWAKPIADDMGIDVNELIKDGVISKNTFAITQFALNASNKQSAVSQVHSKYARGKLPNYKWINITNGVHLPRWQDSDFRNKSISDKELWNLHMTKKRELVETVTKRTGLGYDPEKLVITWARRLAQYKQPKAIFEDTQKLRKILGKPSQPVQLLYAGNTHASDPHSKSLIEEVINIFAKELTGYAIFVPNYNISLANHLTSGSDVWLNTPRGNMEACGTSGMKAISNGVLNCTVIDGWTYEVDWEGVGWNIEPKNVADSFYEILEKEIIPLYYERNAEGLPIKWIERMRKSLVVADHFSTQRMLDEYSQFLYS
jgi:glucan phosphorylase